MNNQQLWQVNARMLSVKENLPYFLPSKNPGTYLIIMKYHIANGHSGVSQIQLGKSFGFREEDKPLDVEESVYEV